MGAHEIIGVFSDSQTINTDEASSNTIDMAVTNPQFGVGHPIFLCIRSEIVPTNEGDDMSIELQLDDDNGSGAPESVWDICAFMPLAGIAGVQVDSTDERLATIGAWIYRGPLPYGINKRHMRLYYNFTGSGTFQVSAWLEDIPQSDRIQVAQSNVGNP